MRGGTAGSCRRKGVKAEWHEVKGSDKGGAYLPTAEECSQPDRRIDPHLATTRLVRVESACGGLPGNIAPRRQAPSWREGGRLGTFW